MHVPLDEDPAAAASPFAGLIQSARFYQIFLLLVWVGAMVHAWFATRKFNRRTGSSCGERASCTIASAISQLETSIPT